MGSKPPIRQNPAELAGVDQDQAAAEAGAQVRQRRRAERPKATYDLPTWLTADVARIAAAEDVAQSDIAALALARFVADYDAGALGDLAERKMPTRSLRATWKLAIPRPEK